MASLVVVSTVIENVLAGFALAAFGVFARTMVTAGGVTSLSVNATSPTFVCVRSV